MAELDRLRAAYRQVPPAATEHLSKEQWERLALDEMHPAEKETALDHILSCTECSQVYRGILALREEAHTFDPGAPVPAAGTVPAHRPCWWRILSGLAAAAAIIVVVLLVRLPAPPGSAGPAPSESVTRRAGETPVKPVLVSPLGAVHTIPGALSWRPVEGVRGYVVELLDGDGELLWKSRELRTTTVPWPGSIKPAPARYYWRVLAIPAEGGRPVASELGSFEVGVTASPR